MSFNQKLPDSGNRESQRHHMHHGFDWPPPPPLSSSLQGLSVINHSQADYTLPGPFCSASGPEPTDSGGLPSSYTPCGSGENPRSIRRGRGEGESSCTGHNHLFSIAQHQGAHLVSHLRTLQRSAARLSRTRWPWGDGVRSSLGPGKGRNEEKCSSAQAFPETPLPPPGRREGVPRRAVRKRCGVAGPLGEGRTPAQAPPPRLRGRTRAWAGSRDAAPGGWAEAQRRVWSRQVGARREGPP